MVIELPATEEKLRSLSAKYVGTALRTSHSPYLGTPQTANSTGTLTNWMISVTPMPPMFAAKPPRIRPVAPLASRSDSAASM